MVVREVRVREERGGAVVVMDRGDFEVVLLLWC